MAIPADSLDTRFVGAALREHTAFVGWRQSTNYAAAVGDDNPRYFDDEREGGLIAPPLLATALTWPLSVVLPQAVQAEGFPQGPPTGQVHYSEVLVFHELLRPGMNLVIKGKIAAILEHDAGAHVVVRYDAFDKDDEPVFTEFTGAILRGLPAAGSAGVERLIVEPAGPWPEEPVMEAAIPVDPLAPYVYDGCTDIVFPIHTSPRFARSVGLPGILLQGTATLALIARELVNRLCDGDPAGLRVLGCRFTGMIRPGTQIRVRLLQDRTSDEGRDVLFDVVDADGRSAVRKGHARLLAQP